MKKLDSREIIKAGVKATLGELGFNESLVEKIAVVVEEDVVSKAKMLAAPTAETVNANSNIHITTQSCNVNIGYTSSNQDDVLHNLIRTYTTNIKYRPKNVGRGQQFNEVLKKIFKKYLGIEDAKDKAIRVVHTNAYRYVLDKVKTDLGISTIHKGIDSALADKLAQSLYESFSTIGKNYNGGGIECLSKLTQFK
jgi:hypothetical protein